MVPDDGGSVPRAVLLLFSVGLARAIAVAVNIPAEGKSREKEERVPEPPHPNLRFSASDDSSSCPERRLFKKLVTLLPT